MRFVWVVILVLLPLAQELDCPLDELELGMLVCDAYTACVQLDCSKVRQLLIFIPWSNFIEIFIFVVAEAIVVTEASVIAKPIIIAEALIVIVQSTVFSRVDSALRMIC
jgi:hypothetical protein